MLFESIDIPLFFISSFIGVLSIIGGIGVSFYFFKCRKEKKLLRITVFMLSCILICIVSSYYFIRIPIIQIVEAKKAIIPKMLSVDVEIVMSCLSFIVIIGFICLIASLPKETKIRIRESLVKDIKHALLPFLIFILIVLVIIWLL